MSVGAVAERVRPFRRRKRRKAHNAVDPQRVALYTSWALDPTTGAYHRHVATFHSDDGIGQTDEKNGHAHRVHNLEVMGSADHTHELTATRGFLPQGVK